MGPAQGVSDVCGASQAAGSGRGDFVMGWLSDAQFRHLPPGIIGIAKTISLAVLAEIYSAADVFVNPTLEDNFPTTNLEALACGTPVLMYDSGGSPECIDEQTGIVVKRGDLSSLLSAIATVKARGKSAYTTACRHRAEVHFDKNARFAEYLEIYEAKYARKEKLKVESRKLK